MLRIALLIVPEIVFFNLSHMRFPPPLCVFVVFHMCADELFFFFLLCFASFCLDMRVDGFFPRALSSSFSFCIYCRCMPAGRRRARVRVLSWTPLCKTWRTPSAMTTRPSLSSSASTLRRETGAHSVDVGVRGKCCYHTCTILREAFVWGPSMGIFCIQI